MSKQHNISPFPFFKGYCEIVNVTLTLSPLLYERKSKAENLNGKKW